MNLFEKLESKCYNFIHIKLLLIRSVCLFPALAGPEQCWLLGQVESPESQQDPGAAQSAHVAVGPLRCLLQVVLATPPAVCSRHLEQTGCRKHSRLGELGHLLLFLLLFLFFPRVDVIQGTKSLCPVSLSPEAEPAHSAPM